MARPVDRIPVIAVGEPFHAIRNRGAGLNSHERAELLQTILTVRPAANIPCASLIRREASESSRECVSLSRCRAPVPILFASFYSFFFFIFFFFSRHMRPRNISAPPVGLTRRNLGHRVEDKEKGPYPPHHHS